MTTPSKSPMLGFLGAASLVALGLACSGGGGAVLPASGSGPSSQSGTVALSIRDASTEDWATIGVKLLRISLIPLNGTAENAVTVYTAPVPAPVINLVQLDQISEVLGSFPMPAGTFSAAVLVFSVNPGDVTLVSAADPSPAFPGTAATAYPSGQIQIQTQGAVGPTGGLTLPVTVPFTSRLAVSSGQTSSLDLEIDLSNPGFIVEQEISGDALPFWAVNFNAPLVRQNPDSATGLVLRHLYGTFSSVATDFSAITVTKDYPTWPVLSPETAQASTASLSILADSANGTSFTNLDTMASSTITDFSSVAGTLASHGFLRIAARYQAPGSLVAVRMWASSSFNTVYAGPEGHILHVDPVSGIVTVENEAGAGVPVTVTSATQFFFRNPGEAMADATAIDPSGGLAFLTADDLVRGFKVHVTVVAPSAAPLVAQSVDIESAKFDGFISASSLSGFTCTRTFATVADDYTQPLGFISASSANGNNPQTGAPVQGFKWWDMAFPEVVQALPIPSFVGNTAGVVDFGVSIGQLHPWGTSYVTWADPAAPSAWSAKYTILGSLPLPLGTVGSAWSATGGSFGLTLAQGANTVNVDLNLIPGSATLVYQVDRTGDVVTITAVDITTMAGQATLATFLTLGSPVQVFGVPQNDGSIRTQVLLVYSGSLPGQ